MAKLTPDLPKASWREVGLPFLSLFGSLSTLVCCALPALLVALGFGATVVGLTSSMPWLITLSMHKEWVFGGSFLMLSLAGFMVWRSRNWPCPIDPIQRRACLIGRKVSFFVTLFSMALWGIGFYVAFFLA